MTKILKTGLQFMGTSAAVLVLGVARWLPIKEKLKHGTLNDLDALRFHASGLLGFISLATGLAAAIYLISAGIEGIGSLIWRRRPREEAEPEAGGYRR